MPPHFESVDLPMQYRNNLPFAYFAGMGISGKSRQGSTRVGVGICQASLNPTMGCPGGRPKAHSGTSCGRPLVLFHHHYCHRKSCCKEVFLSWPLHKNRILECWQTCKMYVIMKLNSYFAQVYQQHGGEHVLLQYPLKRGWSISNSKLHLKKLKRNQTLGSCHIHDFVLKPHDLQDFYGRIHIRSSLCHWNRLPSGSKG